MKFADTQDLYLTIIEYTCGEWKPKEVIKMVEHLQDLEEQHRQREAQLSPVPELKRGKDNGD